MVKDYLLCVGCHGETHYARTVNPKYSQYGLCFSCAERFDAEYFEELKQRLSAAKSVRDVVNILNEQDIQAIGNRPSEWSDLSKFMPVFGKGDYGDIGEDYEILTWDEREKLILRRDYRFSPPRWVLEVVAIES